MALGPLSGGRGALESYPVSNFFGIGPGQAKPWQTTVWEIR